jgi:hypothetical protein
VTALRTEKEQLRARLGAAEKKFEDLGEERQKSKDKLAEKQK